MPSTGFSRYPRYLGTAKVIRLLPIGSPNDTSKTVAGARTSFFLFSGVAIEKQRLVDQRVYGGRLNRSFSGEQISNCCLSLTVTGSEPGVTPPETDSLHTARPHHHSLILHPDYYWMGNGGLADQKSNKRVGSPTSSTLRCRVQMPSKSKQRICPFSGRRPTEVIPAVIPKSRPRLNSKYRLT